MVSIIVPCCNERETIVQVMDSLIKLPFEKEIIVVDDGSTDGTQDILESIFHNRHEECPLYITCHPENLGKGAALKTGLQHAQGSVVIFQDADLEYNPEEIIKVVEPVLSGKANICYGSRFKEKGAKIPLMYYLANKFLTLLTSLVIRQRLTDMETCYKAFRSWMIKAVKISESGFGIEPELTIKMGRHCKIHEVPISYAARSRSNGKKIGFKDGLWAIFCIFKYGLA